MKHKLKITIIIFIATIVLLVMPLQAISIENNSNKLKEIKTAYDVEAKDETDILTWQGVGKNPNMEYCRHGIACEFDDESMTLTNVYKGNRVQDVLLDVECWADNHYAVVLYNGQEVTEGELLAGMTVRIYHNDLLYGEYTIETIHEIACF